MAKKKEVKDEKLVNEAGEVKDSASGVEMHLTNNQRCAWIAPLQLLGVKTVVSSCVVNPMNSIKVDKGRFDFQMKHSVAFRALIDNDLVIARKVKNIDERDLKSVSPAKAPPELVSGGKFGNKEQLKVVNQAVTLDVSTNK